MHACMYVFVYTCAADHRRQGSDNSLHLFYAANALEDARTEHLPQRKTELNRKSQVSALHRGPGSNLPLHFDLMKLGPCVGRVTGEAQASSVRLLC